MGYDDPSKTTEILDITMSPLVKPKHCFNSYSFPLSKYVVSPNYQGIVKATFPGVLEDLTFKI